MCAGGSCISCFAPDTQCLGPLSSIEANSARQLEAVCGKGSQLEDDISSRALAAQPCNLRRDGRATSKPETNDTVQTAVLHAHMTLTQSTPVPALVNPGPQQSHNKPDDTDHSANQQRSSPVQGTTHTKRMYSSAVLIKSQAHHLVQCTTRFSHASHITRGPTDAAGKPPAHPSSGA